MSCTNRTKEECFSKLGNFIDGISDKKGALITVLHKAQEIFGYLPPEVQEYVAEKLGVSQAKIYGVVTFYSYFTMKPKGKYAVAVCMGTACYVRGADKVLEEFERILDIKTGETSKDGLFSIDSLRCVGACGLAPVVLVGDKVHGRLNPEDVKDIVNQYKNS